MPRRPNVPRHPVYALTTTTLAVPGQRFRVAIQLRNLYWSDDAAVLAYPDMFSPVDPALPRLAGWEPEVEQATAAPGEKRETVRG